MPPPLTHPLFPLVNTFTPKLTRIRLTRLHPVLIICNQLHFVIYICANKQKNLQIRGFNQQINLTNLNNPHLCADERWRSNESPTPARTSVARVAYSNRTLCKLERVQPNYFQLIYILLNRRSHFWNYHSNLMAIRRGAIKCRFCRRNYQISEVRGN